MAGATFTFISLLCISHKNLAETKTEGGGKGIVLPVKSDAGGQVAIKDNMKLASIASLHV